MKLRILSLMMSLVLLLSACGAAQPEPPEHTTEVPAQTEAIPSTASSPAEPPERQDTPEDVENRSGESPEDVAMTERPRDDDLTESPEELETEEPAQTETDPPYIPPGGWQVYTDPSQYTPYKPVEAVFTKPEGRDYSALQPQEEACLIYPYASSTLYSSTEDGYSYGGAHLYGFANEKGEILTDGLYVDVEPLIDYTASYYYEAADIPATRVQLPIWRMEIVDDVTVQHYDSEYGSWSYPEGVSYYGLAAMDGSFVLPCVYRSILLLEDGAHILCVRSWDEPDFEIYDPEGTLLMTGSNLFAGYRDCDSWSVSFSEGLYLIYASYESAMGGNSEEACICWFADEQGKKVLGPYKAGNSFHDGLACVSEDGETYGYVDKTGTWVISPRFSGVANFEDGRTRQYYDGDVCVVIDKSGRELIRSEYDYISTEPCGYSVEESYADDSENGRIHTFYDRDGNVILSEAGNWSCVNEHVFACSDVDDGILLRSDQPGVDDLTVEGAVYAHMGTTMIDGKPIPCIWCSTFTDGPVCFVSPDLSGIIEVQGEEPDNPWRHEPSYETYDEYTGKRCWTIYDGSAVLVYDSDFVLLGRSGSYAFRIIDGKILETTELTCTFRDSDGTILFRYPIMAED